MRVVVGTKAYCYINIYIYIHIDTRRVAGPAPRCYRVWTVWRLISCSRRGSSVCERLISCSRRGSRVFARGSSCVVDVVVECLRAAHLV